MYKEDIIHVILAADENYAEFVSVVIVSLLHTNKQFSVVHVHLLANEVSPDTIEKIKSHLPANRGELHVYNISDLQQRLGIEVPKTIAISSYARLFMADLLPNDLDRVLYLDCDIVVSGNIQSFWSVPLDDNYVAGVRDTLPDNSAKIDIGLANDAEYLNAGVLLINLKLWREEKISQKFIDFLYAHNGHVHHHDQGIINAVCHNRKLIVHPRYNLASNYLSHPYWLLKQQNKPFYSEEDVCDAKQQPAILHFTEGFYNRPWVSNTKHPFAHVFNCYHDMTLWKNMALRPDGRGILTKILSWEFLTLPYWCYQITIKVFSLLRK